MKNLKEAKKQGQFYYESAATIKKEADGDVHYHESGDMSTGEGAGIGAIIGGVIGILGGPVGIALGAGAGAAIGAIAAHGDAGFRDSSLKEIGTSLRPGSSALMIITSKDFLHEFRKQVSDDDLYPLMQAVGSSIADAQVQGKDMLLGFVLTDQGVAVQRLAFDDTSAEVFGAVVTDEGVTVGQAYADESGVVYQVGVADDSGAAVETGATNDQGAVVVDQVATLVSDDSAPAADDSDDSAPAADDSDDSTQTDAS